MLFRSGETFEIYVSFKEGDVSVDAANFDKLSVGGSAAVIESGAIKLELKAGDSVLITGIPDGVTYTVNEKTSGADFYYKDTYTKDLAGNISQTGTFTALAQTWKCEVVNTRLGNGVIQITKNVFPEPKPEDKDKPFGVTVTFENAGGSTWGSDAELAGLFTTKSTNATYKVIYGENEIVVSFDIKHGEAVTIENIPNGCTYVIDEPNITSEYKMLPIGSDGFVDASGPSGGSKEQANRDNVMLYNFNIPTDVLVVTKEVDAVAGSDLYDMYFDFKLEISRPDNTSNEAQSEIKKLLIEVEATMSQLKILIDNYGADNKELADALIAFNGFKKNLEDLEAEYNGINGILAGIDAHYDDEAHFIPCPKDNCVDGKISGPVDCEHCEGGYIRGTCDGTCTDGWFVCENPAHLLNPADPCGEPDCKDGFIACECMSACLGTAENPLADHTANGMIPGEKDCEICLGVGTVKDEAGWIAAIAAEQVKYDDAKKLIDDKLDAIRVLFAGIDDHADNVRYYANFGIIDGDLKQGFYGTFDSGTGENWVRINRATLPYEINPGDATVDKGTLPVLVEPGVYSFTLKHDGKLTISNLPIGVTYTITEVTPTDHNGEAFNMSKSGVMCKECDEFNDCEHCEGLVSKGAVIENEKGNFAAFKNAYDAPKGQITVTKVWANVMPANASIKVTLLVNGAPDPTRYPTVTLNGTPDSGDSNNKGWSYTFTGLDLDKTYKVIEEHAYANYTITIVCSGGNKDSNNNIILDYGNRIGNVVITNTYVSDPPPPPPPDEGEDPPPPPEKDPPDPPDDPPPPPEEDPPEPPDDPPPPPPPSRTTPPPPPDTPNPEPVVVFDDDGTPLGEWKWDDDEWIFEEYVPLGALPTGDASTAVFALLALTAMVGIALVVFKKRKTEEN